LAPFWIYETTPSWILQPFWIFVKNCFLQYVYYLLIWQNFKYKNFLEFLSELIRLGSNLDNTYLITFVGGQAKMQFASRVFQGTCRHILQQYQKFWLCHLSKFGICTTQSEIRLIKKPFQKRFSQFKSIIQDVMSLIFYYFLESIKRSFRTCS
jgi:hypothetical protein